MAMTTQTSNISIGTRPPDLPQVVSERQEKPLYSDKLKTSVSWDNRLKRNVLEISLEKDEGCQESLDQVSILRLFRTLGIDTEKEVEGYFQRNKSLHVWLLNGINLDKFCKNEGIRVSTGIKTGFIRPSGKKEVTVTVSGLDFNTPDTFVMSYLNRFGKASTDKVIYDRYKEGPFIGKFNGDRKYQVDFTESDVFMGTFHLIDGSRVKVFYPGNRKTCGRCHQTADTCKGEAIARDCEENGGSRVDLATHMKQLWIKVGFQPHEFNLDADNDRADVQILDKNAFSPQLRRPASTQSDLEKLDGLSLKNFPRTLSREQIITFLVSKGLPSDFQTDLIAIGKHGNVEISNLDTTLCQTLLKNIHFSETREKFFGKPIYCRAIRQMTPVKENLPVLPENGHNSAAMNVSSESDASANYETGYDEEGKVLVL